MRHLTLTAVIVLSLISNAYCLPDRPGSKDLHFADEHIDNRAIGLCKMDHSYTWHNIVLMDAGTVNDQGVVRISTIDKISQRKNVWTMPSLAGGNRAIKISDKGPTDGTKNGTYMNVAIYLDENGNNVVSYPKFSSDSGATFNNLTFNPQAPYQTFVMESFPRGIGAGKSSYFMEFANGKLYVFYYTRHNTSDQSYALNLEAFDVNGNSVFYQQLTTWVDNDTDFLSRINVVRINDYLAALVYPYKFWTHDAIADRHTSGIIVFDTASNTVREEMHVGETSLNPGNFSGFYSERIHNTNYLATDGRSLYLMNVTENYVNPDYGTIQPQGQIRMFPPDGNGMYLHSNTSYDTPLIDLNNLPAQVYFSDIFKQTYLHSSKGDVFGFAAPNYRRNWKNYVDFMYRDPDETNQNKWPLKKVRIQFSQDGSQVLNVSDPWNLNDIPSSTGGIEVVTKYDQMEPPYGFAAYGVPGDGTSLVSAPRGTAASWCQQIVTTIDGSTIYHFVDNS